MNADPIEVLVVEDHPAVREGVEGILRRAGNRIAEGTDDPDAAHEAVLHQPPDVVLLDVSLSNADGIDLAQTLLRDRPEQKILLYTGFADDRRLGDALAGGVRGVALKAGAPEELVEAVQAVAADGVYLDPRLREVLGRSGSPRSANALSPREAEIFQLLAQGLTGEEIAHRLVLSSETVRTHVRNGMRRMGARTRSHAVARALTTGEIEP